MNRDQLRERLNFYRDLGVDEIYVRQAIHARASSTSP